ncbi:MAG: hypothetical protein KA970_13875, partial [Alicycliphilus sp.]|nr:hypothetical protein [Alicycliphilus sp.]
MGFTLFIWRRRLPVEGVDRLHHLRQARLLQRVVAGALQHHGADRHAGDAPQEWLAQVQRRPAVGRGLGQQHRAAVEILGRGFGPEVQVGAQKRQRHGVAGRAPVAQPDPERRRVVDQGVHLARQPHRQAQALEWAACAPLHQRAADAAHQHIERRLVAHLLRLLVQKGHADDGPHLLAALGDMPGQHA